MATVATVVFLVLWAAAPIYVAYRIGSQAGRQYAWVWALFLGWIGVLIVAIITRGDRDRREREEAVAMERESGVDIEAEKLRKFGLE